MHFWNSISTQMIDHEVGNLVSAITHKSKEKPRQSEENEMQLKQDASSRMQDQWNSSRRILCSSQCQIRNANFAKPISQCQNQFRNAKILFMCHNLCEISHCEIHNPLCEFRKPISHCEIHCLCEIQFRKPFRIAKFTLRNLQALSSSVINAEPPSIFGVLLFCPIT